MKEILLTVVVCFTMSSAFSDVYQDATDPPMLYQSLADVTPVNPGFADTPINAVLRGQDSATVTLLPNAVPQIESKSYRM